MESDPRYEVVNAIATGDFATVYRARDRELGREVAIKQIHEQFLADPRQLERFWHEAQLLASLQHPNILTIYDLVRPRGWLVLELMRGSLAPHTQGEPVNLKYLRATLMCCLRALQFLHDNGIVHGDVKPSNMLLDMQNRVKLGDFGLARRASSEEGSLLKGTTKYMAPELVSNQFGPRGPASDLYSLGFSAYELMCGSHFESLFPGLSTFAQDKQIAWLMWHAAADRHLPQIDRVLEGVPGDLSRVIQNLVHKDPARRYPSAEAALAHLRLRATGDVTPPPPSSEDLEAEAEKAEEAKRKKTLRIGAIVAMVFSLGLCVMMMWPTKPPPVPTKPPKSVSGVVHDIDLTHRVLILENALDGSPLEIEVSPRDELLLNDRGHLLRDLEPGDRVLIQYSLDATGQKVTRIIASRPETTQGRIAAVDLDQSLLTVTTGPDDPQRVVRVPESLPITFNGKDQINGQPVVLADLNLDDHVTVHHLDESGNRMATDLTVLRDVTLIGIVRDVDAAKGELTVEPEDDPANLIVLPVASTCETTINHSNTLGGRLVKPGDLKPGDRATLTHDTHVSRVDAYRVLGQAGTIQKIQEAAGRLDVLIDGDSRPTGFRVGPETETTLAGEPVALAELHVGDQVDVTHDSPGAQTPQALSVAAVRPVDATRWAVLVGIQNYEDGSLTRLENPAADATRLQTVLVERYRVPSNQAVLLADVRRMRLEQGLLGTLNRAKSGDRVVLYLAAHAYRDEDGQIYLAPTDFKLSQIAGSGVALRWVLDRLEKCSAGEKLLLLDCTHAGSGADLDRQPSAAEMLETLRSPSGRTLLRTVTAIAATSPGQRGYLSADTKQGLFAAGLDQGLRGAADTDRDGQIEPDELTAYLDQSMKTAAGIGQTQTPKLFLPDTTPPRFADDAKKSIRKLALHLGKDRPEMFEVNLEYSIAEKQAGKQPEPKLLYAMILIKDRQRDEAARLFDEVNLADPKLPIPLQGLAWLDFEKRAYAPGMDKLVRLIDAVPKLKKVTDPYPESSRQIFEWVGQIREFAALGAQESLRPPPAALEKLDDAVTAHTSEAGRLYQQGRAKVQQVVQKFDEESLAGNDAVKSRVRVERRQLTRYAEFPFQAATDRILDDLDE